MKHNLEVIRTIQRSCTCDLCGRSIPPREYHFAIESGYGDWRICANPCIARIGNALLGNAQKGTTIEQTIRAQFADELITEIRNEKGVNAPTDRLFDVVSKDSVVTLIKNTVRRKKG